MKGITPTTADDIFSYYREQETKKGGTDKSRAGLSGPHEWTARSIRVQDYQIVRFVERVKKNEYQIAFFDAEGLVLCRNQAPISRAAAVEAGLAVMLLTAYQQTGTFRIRFTAEGGYTGDCEYQGSTIPVVIRRTTEVLNVPLGHIDVIAHEEGLRILIAAMRLSDRSVERLVADSLLSYRLPVSTARSVWNATDVELLLRDLISPRRTVEGGADPVSETRLYQDQHLVLRRMVMVQLLCKALTSNTDQLLSHRDYSYQVDWRRRDVAMVQFHSPVSVPDALLVGGNSPVLLPERQVAVYPVVLTEERSLRLLRSFRSRSEYSRQPLIIAVTRDASWLSTAHREELKSMTASSRCLMVQLKETASDVNRLVSDLVSRTMTNAVAPPLLAE